MSKFQKVVLGIFAFLMAVILGASALGYMKQHKGKVTSTPTPIATVTPTNAPRPTATQVVRISPPQGADWVEVANDTDGIQFWMLDETPNPDDSFGCQYFWQTLCSKHTIRVYVTGNGQYWLNGWDINSDKPTLSQKLKMGDNVVAIPQNTRLSFGTLPTHLP